MGCETWEVRLYQDCEDDIRIFESGADEPLILPIEDIPSLIAALQGAQGILERRQASS
jgi:hypothetical protein